MPPDDTAVLKIESAGNVQVYRVRLFLSAIDYAYNYIYVGQMLSSDIQEFRRFRELRFSEQGTRFGLWVPKKDRLVLKSVELRSPGVWEFLGKMDPLETMRKYMQDRHERRKDRAYREAAEERALELNNRLKEAQVLGAQIDNARKMGATDEDLEILRDRFIRRPLMELDRYQDEGIIGNSSVSPSAPALEEGGTKERPIRRITLKDED